jgi:hypothetical protein
MKRFSDDLGSTIDEQDNLLQMFLIEQAIEAAYQITDDVSRSFALSDCVATICDFAQEKDNGKDYLEFVSSLLSKIDNTEARIRAFCSYASALAFFGENDIAEKKIKEALSLLPTIRDDFSYRDALFELLTTITEIGFLIENPSLLTESLLLFNSLSQGQQAYIKAYLSTFTEGEEKRKLLKEALTQAAEIPTPSHRSKVLLELAALLVDY